MEETEFEKRLEELLSQDYSAGTEVFRSELLARCLDELNANEDASSLEDNDEDEDGENVSDSNLEMLAAAGNLAAALAEGRMTLARPTLQGEDNQDSSALFE